MPLTILFGCFTIVPFDAGAQSVVVKTWTELVSAVNSRSAVVLGADITDSKPEDAVNYALNQKQYLRAFLNNGEVEISHNIDENAIRPFVIGRKNWLFSDTVKGAKSSAIIYSLIETAKANNIEPYTYLNLILTNMQYIGRPFSNEDLESFMPWSKEIKESIATRTKPAPLTEE